MVHSDSLLSPGRGSAERSFCLDFEYQEDREGPQLTSSNGRSQVRPATAVFNAFESGAGCAVAMMTRMRMSPAERLNGLGLPHRAKPGAVRRFRSARSSSTADF